MLILCSLILYGCEKDDTTGSPMDQELMPFFDSFEAEASLRGKAVDIAGIGGSIETLSDTDVVGQCVYNSNQADQIIISRSYWDSASDLKKEFIVFHELGHCALRRDHLDQSNRGFCISIMHSSDEACRINYNTNTRESYIDELFN